MTYPRDARRWHCDHAAGRLRVALLNDALRELARIDERQAHIVELKYFGRLSEEEVAAALSLSRATITREWQSARAWLFRRVSEERRVDD
jgi:RNA polymerase sigma factor (sigma-70 family)